MDQNQSRAVLHSPEFQALVSRRLVVSLTLTALVLAVYFGFILLLAFDKAVLTQKIGDHVTLGIPVGIGVILLSWVATGIYTRWANRHYDAAVAGIRSRTTAAPPAVTGEAAPQAPGAAI